MSTTATPERTTFTTGELVVITGEQHAERGRTATVVTVGADSMRHASFVKILDGPRLWIANTDLMDAAEFWEREDAHR